MAEYIRDSAGDPGVRAAAEYAQRHFGRGSRSPAMLAWAVFWYVKHCVEFRNDEATLFRIGERDQQDLLISPSVLVRMKKPAEDCDGFTMLSAAMLTALGVPVVIVTVAVDPRDRSRWSHVFPMALVGDKGVAIRAIPLDASHGVGPGWMVPREHINRWQAWNLEAKPVDIKPAAFQGLHGYRRVGPGRTGGAGGARGVAYRRRVRGMGEVCISYEGGECVVWGPEGSDMSTWGAGGSGTWGGSSGGDWSKVLQGAITQGVSLVDKIFAPPAYQQTVRDPVTGQLYTTTVQYPGAGAAAAAGGPLLGAGMSGNTVLLIGGGILAALLVASMVKRD
jgi:hypothetical protein